MPTLFTPAFVRFLNAKAFDESAHPRGQPENAGQFAPSEGASEAVEKAKESTRGRKVQKGSRGAAGEPTKVPSQEVSDRVLEAHTAALDRFESLGISTEGMRDIKIVYEPESGGGAYATGTGLTHTHGDMAEQNFQKHYAETKQARAKGEVPTYAFESPEDVMIHEIGHNIGRHLSNEDLKEWERLYEKYGDNADNLPSFAAQENSAEMWAESVVAVVRGYKFGGTASEYGEQNPEIENFVRSRLGLSGGSDSA